MDDDMKLCATAIVLATQALLNNCTDSSEESDETEDSDHFTQEIPNLCRRQDQNLRRDVEELEEAVKPKPKKPQPKKENPKLVNYIATRRQDQNLRRDVEELEEPVKPKPKKAKPKKENPKLVNYIATVNAYQPDTFKSHFRMSRRQVELLEGVLYQRFEEICSADGRPNIALNYRILLSLWTLGNQESFRAIANRFGVGVGTAHDIFMETCNLLTEQSPTFVKWPTEYSSLVAGFNASRSTPFPGVIGAIDGLDISIICPRHVDKKEYFNGKGSYSSYGFKMQGICDSNRRFLNAFVGYPGASSDAAMWQASGVCQVLSNINSPLPSGYHLIGDSAYPLQSFLMKPYYDNGQLSPKQIYFNKILNSSRIVIKEAFGLLKGRFRRLNRLGMHQITDMSIVINAACVLHNFIQEQNISDGNEENDFEVDIEPNCSEIEENQSADRFVDQYDRHIAVNKRDKICDRLWAERS